MLYKFVRIASYSECKTKHPTFNLSDCFKKFNNIDEERITNKEKCIYYI